MNKQAKANGGRGIEWTDYTWNPIKGCFHACQWEMPDGSIANCYAEDVAHRVAGHAYPHGFEHHYFEPKVLYEPSKLHIPSKIFTGSMADVFGHWVPEEQIQQVLDIIEMCPQHTFQLLTKNPVRALRFNIPKNVWLGCSTPPDFMWNKPLSSEQKQRMFLRSMNTLGELQVEGVTTWISAEPLSWDVGEMFWDDYNELNHDRPVFDWIVVGAASNGAHYFQPDSRYVESVLTFCNTFDVPVFMKGNLRPSLGKAFPGWREEFPALRKAEGEAV